MNKGIPERAGCLVRGDVLIDDHVQNTSPLDVVEMLHSGAVFTRQCDGEETYWDPDQFVVRAQRRDEQTWRSDLVQRTDGLKVEPTILTDTTNALPELISQHSRFANERAIARRSPD